MTSRGAALAASAAVHAGVAFGLAGVGPAHATGPGHDAMVEIDLVASEVAEISEIPVARDDPKSEVRAAARAWPPHKHDYPLPPSHDHHPHDPSTVHADEVRATGTADDPKGRESGEASAVASPPRTPPPPAAPATSPSDAPLSAVVRSAPPEAAAMPRFFVDLGRSAGLAPSVAGSSAVTLGSHGSAGTSDAEPLPGSAVTVPARLVFAARAMYPEAARSAGTEADVPLEIVVDTTGAVVDARLAGASVGDFGAAALAAIRRYRFSAAQREGRAVRVRMKWVVHFRLED